MGKMFFIIFSPLLFNLIFSEENLKKENDFGVEDTIPLKANSDEQKKCIDCHSVLFEKKIKHGSPNEDACENCHLSNGQVHPKADTKAFSLIKPGMDLCLSCHEKISTIVSGSEFVHKVVKDKKSCLNCHNPHSSSEKKLLVENKKDLCLNCHNTTMISADQRKIDNIDLLLKTSTVIHPPLKKGCTACHNPHGTATNHLLSFPFPDEEYVTGEKDNFALCFECHDSDILEAPKTTSGTNFRDGDKNLHFIHLQGDKARKCTLCHNPHATNSERLMRDKVKFGNWEYRISFKVNENGGGTCSPGCHSEKTYSQE